MVRTDWTRHEIAALFDLPFTELVFRAAEVHRAHHAPEEVQLCTLLSIKTGGCPEDCGYCAQSVDQRGHQRLVPGGERAGAHGVDLALERQRGGFLRGLEQRTGDDLEAHVGKGAGDHVGAAVVPVLAHLGDQQPRRAPEPAADRLDAGDDLGVTIVVVVGPGIDAAHRNGRRAVASEDDLKRA